MKWVAAADTRDALHAAPHGPILSHRPDKVVTARRVEAALAAYQVTQRHLIESSQGDQRPAWQSDQSCPDEPHRPAFASCLATRLASRGSDSFNPASVGFAAPLGIKTK